MKPATADTSFLASPPTVESPRSLPTLAQLYQWTSEPDQRVVIRRVDWSFYEQLVDSIPEGANIHVDFDGEDLELMTPSPLHDGEKKLFGQFVEAVAQELGAPYQAYGQTTWKRPELRRGLEADECYLFHPEKIAAATAAKARRSRKVADYPNPDLGIEVDISPSKIDRPGIYAALQVAEVWRLEGESQQVIIERLGKGGSYLPVESSTLLPVRAEEVRRWVIEEDSSDHSAWARRLRAWARAELAPRLPH